LQLIAQGEHQMLDFKFGINDSRKIARSMVAFSNTNGGTLLIGVKDNGAIAGVRTEEEYYMVEAAAKMYCKPEINFVAKAWKEEDKTVLEVIIPKDHKEIHYATDDQGRWLAWVRVKDQNILANSIWIRVWHRTKNSSGTFIEYTEREMLLLHHLAANENITLSAYCKMAKINRKTAENVLVNLISLDIVLLEFTDKGAFYGLNPDVNVEDFRLRG
jgi:predicted HTH transcriptional regulator